MSFGVSCLAPPPVSYAVPTERSSPRVASAFAAGCGGAATNDNVLLPGDVALFGSPERVDLLRAAQVDGRTWYYADHGYFRRGRQFRIARNRYQSLVTHEHVAARVSNRVQREHLPLGPSERFQRLHVDVSPAWCTGGSSILICPNSPVYMSWFGIDARQWTLDIVAELSKYTDRPVVIRWKAHAQVRPFYRDIHDAWATVVFSSGAAVESLTHGVPVFVLADWATSAPWGLSDLSLIETPIYPDDREPFLWELAERQWTLDEIRDGVAWRWFQQRTEEAI